MVAGETRCKSPASIDADLRIVTQNCLLNVITVFYIPLSSLFSLSQCIFLLFPTR